MTASCTHRYKISTFLVLEAAPDADAGRLETGARGSPPCIAGPAEMIVESDAELMADLEKKWKRDDKRL